MDQQPIQPVQPAEQPAPAPTPAPTQGPTPPPTPLGGAPNPYGQPPKKNLAAIIIAIVVGVLVIAGIVVAIVVAANKGGDNDKKDTDSSKTTDADKNSTADDDAKRAANAKTAKYLSDFDTVCKTGSISNAADSKAPYKVVAFSNNSSARTWSQVSLGYNADYTAKHDDFSAVNVVACVTEKKGAAVKTTTCDFKSGGEAKSLDYYATSYNVAVYDAKTGKKIKDLGDVGGPADSCPMFVTYDKSDPKIVAKPDANAVDALIAKFVAQ